MKKVSLLFASVFITVLSYGQQLPQLSQYMINDFAINPSLAGMEDAYQIKTSVRNQWVGINDAPKTTLLSIYGKNSERVGLGGSVFNDQVGHTSRAGASITYAYHIPLSPFIKMSLSLSGGFTQFKIDKQGWNTRDENDPLMAGDILVDLVPDATFGMNLYADNWYFGFSIPQLLNSKLALIDDDFANNISVDYEGSLVRHLYVMGLYSHELNPYWDLEPSILLKSVSSAEPIFDIGVKGIYDDKFWIGMDYGTNGEIDALLGLYIQDRYLIGYSYDIITNQELSPYTSGSHEFMFGLSFRPSTEKQIMR